MFTYIKINLLHGYRFYISHSTFYGTTCCRYYPFYVAPFVSDLKSLSRFQISFALDKPLRPFDQLMAVLPSQRHIHHSYCCHLFWHCYVVLELDSQWSSYCFFYSRWLKLNLPYCYCCKFMGREEYYPKLQTDMNGRRFLWTVSYSFICAMDLWTGSIYNFNVYWSTGDAFRNVDSQWKKLFQGISEERLLASTKAVDEELTVKQLLTICAHVTITSSAVA